MIYASRAMAEIAGPAEATFSPWNTGDVDKQVDSEIISPSAMTEPSKQVKLAREMETRLGFPSESNLPKFSPELPG